MLIALLGYPPSSHSQKAPVWDLNLVIHFPARRLGLLGVLVAIAHAVEVGLIFPRNETYSPADWFPIVVAVQSPQDAELLNLRISYSLRHGNDANNSTTPLTHDLRWANLSSSADPLVTPLGKLRRGGASQGRRPPGRPPALLLLGVVLHYLGTFNVTYTTLHSPPDVNSAGRDTCVMTANSTATPDPCRIAIDKDTAASMAAVQHQRLCDGLNAPMIVPRRRMARRSSWR
ncbi:uncharacterized protein BO66DRAFT_437395 [Aspergillus aculeatinus CBS 121060]|uniref:Uncharacterized protein n=1 Tax=Aspergillus aculeatinus CBS 121060 TaxID=1448322 RepID=A0ACD1HCK1_9EURO|nr:hypothetical protein BO66DRAFT_437395 [Aspergillus aculeatinus CBS 121060]RAH71375.1 hypothetical protein BO66DRAFT_437395 [Aspergillus aculeatinus CBS 121060]